MFTDVLGWSAGILTVMAFSMRGMKALRVCAIGANAAFIAYGVLGQLLPVAVLHMLLMCGILYLATSSGFSRGCSSEALTGGT